MSEISKFEKQLNPGRSFEQLLQSLTSDLAWHLYKDDTHKFLDQWDTWVLDLPRDVLDVELLLDIQRKYFLRADVSADDLADYRYVINACVIYAAAAQRAHKRADSCAAWNLLTEANLLISKVNSKQKDLSLQDQKASKAARSLANADAHSQRVRYQIIALLHRDHQKTPVKFKSVKLAMDQIDNDIGRFLVENDLRISYVNLVANVNKWIKENTAFRSAMTPFLADGVIPI